MDFFTFISNIINSLSWPGALIIALFLFRKPLIDLLYAIEKATLKIGNIEAEINLLTKTIIPTSESPKNIKELAAKSPVKAIKESWETLEKTATAAVSPSKPSLSNLLQKNILNEDEATVFRRLHDIRNNVVHQEAVTSVSSASTYSDLAYTLSETIKKRKQP